DDVDLRVQPFKFCQPINETFLQTSRVQASRCRRRAVADFDFRGPVCFFLSHLASDPAGSSPCWLYALVPPAFLPNKCGLAIVGHFYFTFIGAAGVSRLVFVST